MPTLEGNATFSEGIIRDARKVLAEKPGSSDKPLDVVLLGSIARREASPHSDFDFLVIAHGLPAGPKDTRQLLRDIGQLREALNFGEPGRTDLFGRVIAAPELTERIGLQEDTNHNHSRRILLLEESVSVLRPELHSQLLRAVIGRYLGDYDKPKEGVPRFLLNDVIRYWRTLAVDYQAKRWEEVDTFSGLRYLKLIVSRKLAYAATLTSILLCDKATVDYFEAQFAMPALARLAQLSEHVTEEWHGDLRKLFEVAEEFAQLLQEPTFREEARNVRSRVEIEPGSRFERAQESARGLQSSLERIFFHSERLPERSRKYLSF